MRELTAQELNVAPRTGPAIGAPQSHAVEKNQNIKNVGIFECGETAALRLLLLHFADERGQRGVEFAGQPRIRRPFVVNTGAQGLIGLGERLNRGKNVCISGITLGRAELRNRESKRHNELLVCVNNIGWQVHIEQRCVRR